MISAPFYLSKGLEELWFSVNGERIEIEDLEDNGYIIIEMFKKSIVSSNTMAGIAILDEIEDHADQTEALSSVLPPEITAIKNQNGTFNISYNDGVSIVVNENVKAFNAIDYIKQLLVINQTRVLKSISML